MLLPCPHCRRQFRIRREQLPSARARIKCPACEGVFVLNLVASSPVPGESGEPVDSRLRGNDGEDRRGVTGPVDSRLRGNDGEDRRGVTEPVDSCLRGNDGEGRRGVTGPVDSRLRGNDGEELRGNDAPVRHTVDRDRPRFLLFWTLVPACCLLLALSGILLSGPWMSTPAPELSASRVDTGTQAPLSSSVSSHPEVSRRQEAQHRAPGDQMPPPSGQHENPIAKAFWTRPSDPKAPCDALLRSQAELLEAEDRDTCQVYPLWITYLILETESAPVCELGPTFSLATEALQRETLCGPGHAFLCAYYLKRRLLDRSQSFLEKALRQAPDDPWVKLVEAVFYEQAYYDDPKAIGILAGLSRQHSSFSLAGYILGRAYIREEEYSEANAVFESLKEDTKGQIAFWRIRRALSSLEQTADQGEGRAEALLALSRAFSALKDYPMAQDLYHLVLEDMPDKLPMQERIAAYCELGQIYEDRGDNSSAYDSYLNALEIDPEFPAAREGIKDLLPDPSNHS